MPRTGKGSKANPNRTDLNSAIPKQAASSKGREYGSRKEDLMAQEAVPMRPPPPTPQPGPEPGSMGPFSGRSTRPNEPITSGVDIGAGPGLEARYGAIPPYQTPLEKVAAMTQHPRLLRMVRSRNR